MFEVNLCNIKKKANKKSSTKHTVKHITLTDENGDLYSYTVTAQKFNEYVFKVGPTLAAKVGTSIQKFDHYLPKSPMTSAVFNFTYPNEIVSFIQKLKSSNAVGVDEITIKVGKAVANIIANPLSHLINNSLETGIFPSALKISKVIPIFKIGEQNTLSNY